MKITCLMVCTSVQKNAFYHGALTAVADTRGTGFQDKGQSVPSWTLQFCRDMVTFVPVDFYETQTSKIQIFAIEGLQKP